MSRMLEYKGYHASVDYDDEDELFVGSVFGVRDSLNFHGTSVEELKNSFHDCIDNYLDMCKQFGVAPDKEYKGSFNVRLEPKLHRDVAFAAEQQGITMNQYVVNALSSAVYT